MLASVMERCGSCGRWRRGSVLVGVSALALCFAVGLTGVGDPVDISGTFGFDVVAVPIPATLVDEIELDTPAELTLIKFGLEAELDLSLSFPADAGLHLNTAMSIPGLEHCVLDGRIYFGPLLIKPEVWLAVPFETVTDINHFTNWVVIPPGDLMFVKLRCTTEVGVGGFDITNLFMLEDVTFPNPLADFVPLQYTVQSQSFHTGDILTITTEPAPGMSLTSVTRFCATEATNVIKGWSAGGSADAAGSCCGEDPYFNETLSLTGIQYCGMSLWLKLDVKPCDQDILALSGGGTLADILDIGLTGSFSLFPIDFSGFSLVTTLCDAVTATLQFSDTFQLLQMSVRGQCAIDTGIMQGSAFAYCTFVGNVGKACTVGATLGHGTVSAGLSFTFSEQAGSLRLTGTTARLEFRNAPASFTISAGFGRSGLAQAGFGVGISF
jgi:hypothetical protein